jgi:hypothetical protein
VRRFRKSIAVVNDNKSEKMKEVEVFLWEEGIRQ